MALQFGYLVLAPGIELVAGLSHNETPETSSCQDISLPDHPSLLFEIYAPLKGS